MRRALIEGTRPLERPHRGEPHFSGSGWTTVRCGYPHSRLASALHAKARNPRRSDHAAHSRPGLGRHLHGQHERRRRGQLPRGTCSIRGALDAASPTLRRRPTRSSCRLASTSSSTPALMVNSPVIIRGSGARSTVVAGARTRSPSDLRRVFDVDRREADDSSAWRCDGRAAHAGGNVAQRGGNVVARSRPRHRAAPPTGAAIANDSGTMTIQSSLIDGNNVATNNGNGDGGGILNVAGNRLRPSDGARLDDHGQHGRAPGGGICFQRDAASRPSRRSSA